MCIRPHAWHSFLFSEPFRCGFNYPSMAAFLRLFFHFLFLSGYSRLTMLGQFQVNSEGEQPYTCIHSLPNSTPMQVPYNIEQSPMCYIVDPCWLSILNIAVCTSPSQTPYLFLYPSPYSLCSAAAAAKSLQSCPTLCDPIDGSPPGFPVPGILQARTLEWVAISFSNA